MDETLAGKKQRSPLFLWVTLLFCSAAIFLLVFLPKLLPVIAVLALAPLLVWMLQFQLVKIVPALLFLVPLSVLTSVGDGFTMAFPSELLVGVVALYAICLAFYTPFIRLKLLLHPVVLLLLFEVLWMLVCSTASDLPGTGYKRAVVRFVYIVVYLVLGALWVEKIRYRSWLLFIMYALGLVIPVANAMHSHSKFFFSTTSAYMVAYPFFVDHTLYGACLAFVLPMLLLLVAYKKTLELNNYVWMGALALFLFLGTAEILSFSRAAWVSFFLSMVFWLFIRFRVRLWMIVVIIGTLSASVAYSYDAIYDAARRNDAVSNKGTISEHIQSMTNVQTDASNLERINRWSCAWRMALDRPLTGYGPGSYQFEYGRYQLRSEMTRISTFRGNRGHAHSEFFNAISETGFPGGVIYAVILFTVIGYGLKVIYCERDAKMQVVLTGALLGLMTYYVHGFFNAFLDTDKMAALVFGSIAIIIVADLRQKEKSALPDAAH